MILTDIINKAPTNIKEKYTEMCRWDCENFKNLRQQKIAAITKKENKNQTKNLKIVSVLAAIPAFYTFFFQNKTYGIGFLTLAILIFIYSLKDKTTKSDFEDLQRILEKSNLRYEEAYTMQNIVFLEECLKIKKLTPKERSYLKGSLEAEKQRLIKIQEPPTQSS
ncbi:hypothetical protein JXM83_07360 [Candidatus Woesearchaeota archaeon]|nr:hypothetical protein [Candidatus Woesearchaeota archaeon]